MSLKTFKAFGVLGVLLFATTGCQQKSNISFFCERDFAGNYILKWEVSPYQSGEEVQVFMSDNDSLFDAEPILVAKVDDFVVRIPSDDLLKRKFFRLKVGKTRSGVISNPFFRMEAINNFRDLGGYSNNEKKQVKWGKVYRSGDFSELTANDYRVLENLKIKTIIDFRGDDESDTYPDLYGGERVIRLPILSTNRIYIREKIVNGDFLRNDAISFTQQIYKSLVEDYSPQYKEFFNILCDENNYPLAFHAYLGKDRVGLASYFLLKALDVDEEVNEDDYLFSNHCLDKLAVMGEARYLPESMQEAATIACRTDLMYLNVTRDFMIQKSGSVNAFMEKELDITAEKKAKLKKMLLYK